MKELCVKAVVSHVVIVAISVHKHKQPNVLF